MYCAPIPHDDVIRLATLHRYAILDTPAELGYDDVTALAACICQAPFSTITLVDRDRQWFKSEIGFGTNETNRSDGLCACAVLNPEVMIVEDTLDDPRFAQNPFVLDGPQIRFYAGAPLVAPNGQILGTVCVFDIKPRVLASAQIAALEALSRQVMALLDARLHLIEREKAAKSLMQREKLAAVGRMASSMAHAINNPLEAVTNLLFLSRRSVQDTEVQGWLDQAECELRRVAVIANHTLRFHKQSSSPQMVTALALFSTVLNVHEARLKNAGIQVEMSIPAQDAIMCFEGDLRQVLNHLLSNAIDAMPHGGRLLLRSREATDWRTGRRGLLLTHADTGTGMDHETQRRMFEAFFTTKGISGCGLGLWISAEIMQRHNGQITIRSSQREGRSGTVVQLFLPFQPSELIARAC